MLPFYNAVWLLLYLGIAVGHIYYFLEDVFPETQGGFRILKTPQVLKWLCDAPREDPNYNPLPEDRPGGFAWGEGARLGGENEGNEEGDHQQ